MADLRKFAVSTESTSDLYKEEIEKLENYR